MILLGEKKIIGYQNLMESKQNHKSIIIWLCGVAGLVFLMVVIGGITRLTDSGLSMVEWRPLMGALPPLNAGEWGRIYGLYQNSPEYTHINSGMTLDEFKAIFFWEYIHRLLGRLLGVAYGLPLLVFAIKGAIPKGYGWRLGLILGLGGLQGIIGWWMVKSGLIDNPEVSQYRLAIHLSVALIILGLLGWTILDLKDGKVNRLNKSSIALLGLLAITILAGAFVAGLDGGRLYNEYPLMGDGFVPIEYGDYGLSDAFENPAAAQFHHRILALITTIAITALGIKAIASGLAMRGSIVIACVCLQFGLGITTLIYAVPVSLGTLHQAIAALLLLAVIATLHESNRA